MNDKVISGEVVEEKELPVRSETATGMMAQTDKIDADVVIHNIDAQEKVLDRLVKYMKDKLQPQVDYYSVKQSAKPSLGLPGAEKICNIFNLAGKPILEEKVYNSQEVRYEYSCELYHKPTGNFAGSGVGCCSSQEAKYASSKAVDIANTIKKMAYKRAYVDATLKSTMASFLFTQDLEDYYVGGVGGQSSGQSSGQKGKFPSNREYWDKYDWTKVDLNKVPKSPGFDKTKNKPKSATETLKLYFYSIDVLPKEEAGSFISKIVNKKTWEMTYGEIQKCVKALMEVEDDIQAEGKEMENVTNEQLGIE